MPRFARRSESDFLRHGENYLGQMRSKMAGTQFHLYDHGISNSEGGTIFQDLARKQQALLVYKTNVLGRVPNAMSLVLPKPGELQTYGDEEGEGEKVDNSVMYKAYTNNKATKAASQFVVLETKKPRWNPKMEAWTMDFKGEKVDNSVMYKAYTNNKATKAASQFVVLETKKPRWNPKMEAWTMDFKGRAKLASKKNFQLVDVEEEERLLMLFGKMTKNRWCLDYSPPMSPLTCLFVALTAFSAKLAVT